MIDYDRLQQDAEKDGDAVMAVFDTLRAGKVRLLVDKVPKHEFMEFLNQYPVELVELVALDG